MDEPTNKSDSGTLHDANPSDKSLRRLSDITRACVVLSDDEEEDRELVAALERMRLSVQFKSKVEVDLLRNDSSCIIVQDFAAFLEDRDPALLYYGPICIKRSALLSVPEPAAADFNVLPDENVTEALQEMGSKAIEEASFMPENAAKGMDVANHVGQAEVTQAAKSSYLVGEPSTESVIQLPFTGHSMLTTLLLNRRCCLQMSRREQTRRRAQVYALGGRLARRVQDADFLLSVCATGDKYKLARSFEIPVLSPSLLDALWNLRHSIEFELTTDFIEKFRLPVFARLKLNFVGFNDSDERQLSERAMANGAAIVSQVTSEGTYIVVVGRDSCLTEDLLSLDQDLSQESAIVFEDWFYDSICCGYAQCEKSDKYDARKTIRLKGTSGGICSPLGRRKRGANSPGVTPRSKKSVESLLLSPRVEELSRTDSSAVMPSPPAGAASPIRKEFITDRRHLVLLELRDTEENYLKVLEFILRMARTHLGEIDSDKKLSKQHTGSDRDEIITRFERQEIFKEIPNIIALHRTLLTRINAKLEAMDFRNISSIFQGEDACGLLPEVEGFGNGKALKKRYSRKVAQPHDRVPRCMKENNIVATYKTFLNGLETIKERVETLLSENPRFADFVRLVEEQPECNREKFLHLLIRPVQRWPSILNLLKRYAEESEKHAKRLEERLKAVPSTGNAKSNEDAQLRKEVTQFRLCGQDATRVHRFIEDSLRQMNDSKSQTLMISEALRTQNTIEDIPAMYWSKQYTLHYQCEATVLSTSETLAQVSGQKPLKNADVVCFLFSHGLEIARKKVGKHHKPYKHVAFIHFDKINTLLVNQVQDPVLNRLMEIVFREQRKDLCSVVVLRDPCSAPNFEANVRDSLSETDGVNGSSEFFEERILLDLRDAQAKNMLLEKIYESPFDIECIVLATSSSDRPNFKEALRSDSLLLNFSQLHGNTPVTHLTRSLSNVSELSTPKKLTRTFSNLIKRSFLGTSTKQATRDNAAQSSVEATSSQMRTGATAPGTASTIASLSRSRPAAIPRFLSASSPSASSVVGGGSGRPGNHSCRLLSLSPLTRRMDSLVLSTFSSVLASTAAATVSAGNNTAGATAPRAKESNCTANEAGAVRTSSRKSIGIVVQSPPAASSSLLSGQPSYGVGTKPFGSNIIISFSADKTGPSKAVSKSTNSNQPDLLGACNAAPVTHKESSAKFNKKRKSNRT